MLGLLAYALMANVEWGKRWAEVEIERSGYHPRVTMELLHLHASNMKRSIALFCGFTSILLGVASIFFESSARTTSEVKVAESVSAALSTRAPGMFAMLIGFLLMVFAIMSKDRFTSSADGLLQKSSFNAETAPYIPLQ